MSRRRAREHLEVILGVLRRSSHKKKLPAGRGGSGVVPGRSLPAYRVHTATIETLVGVFTDATRDAISPTCRFLLERTAWMSRRTLCVRRLAVPLLYECLVLRNWQERRLIMSPPPPKWGLGGIRSKQAQNFAVYKRTRKENAIQHKWSK